MERYWFKPKCCGWGIGWPITWQGWVSLGILFAMTIFLAFVCGILDKKPAPPTGLTIGSFVVGMTLLSVTFCLLLGNKVEGGLKWRWGGKK
jgi:hypothetical protein